jgi:hypothetical protein
MHNIDYDLEYNNAIDKMAKGGALGASFKINTPTGAPSKLTYIQQLLVRTKAFKEWFGDWENVANRIVSDRAKETPLSQVEKTLVKSFWQNDKSKGNLSRNQIILSFYFLEYKIKDVSHTIDYDTLEPQPYWHGTQAEEFFEFKTNVRVTGRPYSYFALNKSYSENFSQDKTLYSVFTCIKNPYIYINYKVDKGFAFLSEVFIDYGLKNNLESAQIEQLAKDTKYKYVKDYVFNNLGSGDIQFWRLMSRDNKGEFKSFLQSLGYDGVMYVEEIREDADITQADEFTRAVTIFEPNQVKLADGRNTEFSSLNNDIRYAEGGEVNFDKIISSSSRFKPSDIITFDPPLIGKNGTKLVSYQWKYTIESSFNKEGEEYGKRVSDWTQAELSAETGRDLVHVFDVQMPDGTLKSVSSESVLSIMGFVDKDTKKVFGNLATASKTLAKQQMKLAILEAQQKQYYDAKNELENGKKPIIKIAKFNQLPLVIQKTIDDKSEKLKQSDRIYFSMGDVVRPQDLPYNQYVLFKDLDNLDENKYKPTKSTIEDLESTWISKRLSENNIKAPYGLYDLKNRVQRQKNKVEKMLSNDNKYEDGGTTKMDRYEHLLGIQRTTPKFAEGGSISTEHGLTNSGKRGGYFEGRSHAEGGIKAWNTTTNSPLEVEGGEVIITKKAVDDDELYEFEGEKLTNKQILSKINESGGGVKFEEGGEIHQCNCSGKMYKYGGETMEDYQIMNRMNSRYNKKHEMKNHKTSYGHNLMRKMKEGGYC